MDMDSVLSGKSSQGRATDLLREDHRKLSDLFAQYARAMSEKWDSRRSLAEEICMQLDVHTRVEEDVFYPAIRRIDARFVEQALEQHHAIEERIAKIEHDVPEHVDYDEIMGEIMRSFTPHVAAEERLFDELEQRVPEALGVLRAKIMRRKEELTGSTQDMEGRS